MRKLAIVLLLLASGAPALADAGNGRGRRDRDGDSVAVSVGVSFGRDVEVEIRGYFDDHRLEPQGLPPGIAKNLARGKPLPPGIAKRYPPSGLRSRLPSYPGHEVIIVGNDVLLVAIDTRVIADILHDVL